MLPDFAQDDTKTEEPRRRGKKRRGNGRCKWGHQCQHQQRNPKARVQTQQAERECLPAETVNAAGQHIDDGQIDKVTQHEGIGRHLQTDVRQKDEDHAEKDDVKAQLHEEKRLATCCGDDGKAHGPTCQLEDITNHLPLKERYSWLKCTGVKKGDHPRCQTDK